MLALFYDLIIPRYLEAALYPFVLRSSQPNPPDAPYRLADQFLRIQWAGRGHGDVQALRLLQNGRLVHLVGQHVAQGAVGGEGRRVQLVLLDYGKQLGNPQPEGV